VVGITQLIIEAAFSADPIYAPLEAIFSATRKHNEAARLIVASNLATTEHVNKLNQQLKDLYAERHMDINIFTSGTSQQDLTNALNQYAILINMFLAMAVIVGSVGGMGLMGSLFISVVERTREIGVMRAVGAKSHTIMRMFIMEGVLQGLLSWTITIPISFFITQPIAKALGQIVMNVPLDFDYNFSAVLAWLVIILFISTLASILPARNATQISVRESLSYA
jgi:putative ABC transport system permease protein